MGDKPQTAAEEAKSQPTTRDQVLAQKTTAELVKSQADSTGLETDGKRMARIPTDGERAGRLLTDGQRATLQPLYKGDESGLNVYGQLLVEELQRNGTFGQSNKKFMSMPRADDLFTAISQLTDNVADQIGKLTKFIEAETPKTLRELDIAPSPASVRAPVR